MAKAIARHSLTGLNIIIFHDGLFNTSYCHYNYLEKLENNYETSFWKSQHFFSKSERTHMLGPPSRCTFLFAFQWPHPPFSPRRTYCFKDPLGNPNFKMADFVFRRLLVRHFLITSIANNLVLNKATISHH